MAKLLDRATATETDECDIAGPQQERTLDQLQRLLAHRGEQHVTVEAAPTSAAMREVRAARARRTEAGPDLRFLAIQWRTLTLEREHMKSSTFATGDQLVVTKLDRLGHSLEHLIELSKQLQAK